MSIQKSPRHRSSPGSTIVPSSLRSNISEDCHKKKIAGRAQAVGGLGKTKEKSPSERIENALEFGFFMQGMADCL